MGTLVQGEFVCKGELYGGCMAGLLEFVCCRGAVWPVFSNLCVVGGLYGRSFKFLCVWRSHGRCFQSQRLYGANYVTY